MVRAATATTIEISSSSSEDNNDDDQVSDDSQNTPEEDSDTNDNSDDDESDQGRNQQIAGACRGQSELLQSRGRPGRVGRLAVQCSGHESVQMHDIRIMTGRNATGSQ